MGERAKNKESRAFQTNPQGKEGFGPFVLTKNGKPVKLSKLNN